VIKYSGDGGGAVGPTPYTVFGGLNEATQSITIFWSPPPSTRQETLKSYNTILRGKHWSPG